MGIPRPYYRIIRPFSRDFEEIKGTAYPYQKDWEEEFPGHPEYANDRQELWRAYKLVEKDLLRLFEYVEPTDNNIRTYSHRTYELLLRAATEFETNCKRILDGNGYRCSGNPNITDYFKINTSSRLGDYAVSLLVWYPKKALKPFHDWNTGTHVLPWYQSYNLVKHDRNKNFQEASLENVLNAITGLYVILFSQFVFSSGLPSSLYDYRLSVNNTTISTAGDIFGVVPPDTWTEDELYDFDWEEIKDRPDPFCQFAFT